MRSRRDDPWTSHAAAATVDEVAARHYRIILETLRKGPGITYEIAERCGLSNAQVHKRMPELERKGWVALTGDYRLSPSRRKCRVWARIVFTPKQGQLTLPPGPGPLPWA